MRRIDLLIEHGQSLGLMIRGGIEYGLGIFVTGVDKDSVAERSGLMVNNFDFEFGLSSTFICFRLEIRFWKLTIAVFSR